MGKERMKAKSSVPRMLQPFTAWQNRLRKVEDLHFFIGVWVESSPNYSFLLRPLKYFLMEGKALWLIKKKKKNNVSVENWDFTKCKLSWGLDAFFPTFP